MAKKRAVAAGAKLIRPAQDKFYGDRTAHRGSFDSGAEKKRGKKAMKEMGG